MRYLTLDELAVALGRHRRSIDRRRQRGTLRIPETIINGRPAFTEDDVRDYLRNL